MNIKELEKPCLSWENNFGIAFRIPKNRSSYSSYNIYCHIIEKGEYVQRCCVSNIHDKGFARYMLGRIESEWNSSNKILRFLNNPKSIELTPYCEIHTMEELKEYKKTYQKVKKDNIRIAKRLKLKRELRKLEKDRIKLSQKMEGLQKEIKELTPWEN